MRATAAKAPSSAETKAASRSSARPATRDAAEHEADHLAERVLSPTGAPLVPRRAAAPGSGGHPLPAPTREYFERGFGTDLGHVRVHADGHAARAADRLDARAFTVGSDITFGAGELRPETSEGRRLLAHELSHVVLGHAGLRRQPRPPDAALPTSTPPAIPTPTPVAPTPTPVAPTSTPAGPMSTPSTPTLAAALDQMTNVAFVAEIARVRYALSGRISTSVADAELLALRDRIETERRRRVSLGHLWITVEVEPTSARELYQLQQRWNGVIAVVRPDPAVVDGIPSELGANPILTPAQFQERLRLQSAQIALMSELVQQIELARALRAGDPTVGIPRQGSQDRVARPFAIVEPGQAPPQIQNLLVPESTYGVQDGLPFSVEAPLPGYGPAPADQPQRLTLAEGGQYEGRNLRYLIAFDGTTPLGVGADTYGGTRTSAMHGYVVSMQGTGGIGQVMLGQRMLHALRLGIVRHLVKVGDSARTLEFHRRLLSRLGRPEVAVKDLEYWLSAQEMATVALDYGVDMLPQEVAALRRVANGDNGALADLHALVPQADAAARQRINRLLFETQLPGAARDTRAQRMAFQMSRGLLSPYNPEYRASQRLGMGRSTGRAGGMGMGMGALLSLPVDAGVTLVTGGSFDDYWARAPRTLTLGTVGGGLAGATEQALVAGYSSRLLAAGAGPTFSMLGARAIPGGVGAMGAELLNMLVFEDRRHSAGEVTVRSLRAGGLGMASTAAGLGAQSLFMAILASGGTGAAGGTTVGPVGTAVGFVVGLGVGVAVYVVLDRHVPNVSPPNP